MKNPVRDNKKEERVRHGRGGGWTTGSGEPGHGRRWIGSTDPEPVAKRDGLVVSLTTQNFDLGFRLARTKK